MLLLMLDETTDYREQLNFI
uniref:Uncharacterized protein n=1 Tax=Arundo donax TaxID=35708 RepID=A0A0A8ZG17_ARUDO